MPWQIYAVIAGVSAVPLVLRAGSYLGSKRTLARAVPQWRAYAERAGMRFEERSDRITLGGEAESVSAHRVTSGGIGTVRWTRWETRVELPAPASWPPALELYGTRGISEILGFRQRLSVDPEFDERVLVRDGGEGAEEAASRRLCDPSARTRLGACFEDEPALWVAQRRVSVRVCGLLEPQRAHALLQSAQRLRTELSSL